MRGSSVRLGMPRAVLVPLVAAGVVMLAALMARPPLSGFSQYFLVLGAGGAWFLILLWQPGLGLVALAALSFTLPFTLGTGSEVRLTPPVFLIAAIAGAWLLSGMYNRSLRLPASRTLLPLLLFVASGLVSLVAGRTYWDPLVPQPGNFLLVQLGQWGLYALSGVIFLLAAGLGSRGRWLEIATWTFLALASVVVLEFYLPPLRGLLGWSDPNMANRSLFWAWLAALATGQLLFNRRLPAWVRGWLLVLLAAAAYVVWFPMRIWTSGWAPFTVAALAVLCLWVWRRHRLLAVALTLGLLALTLVIYPVLYEHSGGEQEFQTTVGGRQALYRVVLDLASRHPVLGLGPAAYRQYGFARWLGGGVGRALWIRPNISSHNNYLDIYAQQGLAGLALFLWFLLAIARTGWRVLTRFCDDFADGYVQGAVAGFVATLVAMLLADWFLPFVYNIGFGGFRTSALAWMFLGGLVALETTSRGEGADEDGSRR